MKKFLLSLMAVVASLASANADTLNATVKATYISGTDADVNTSYGEVETAYCGYNKISGGKVEMANKGWGVNNIAYVQVDASALPAGAIITAATLKADLQQISARGLNYGVGYNNSEWSSTLTWATADRSITTCGATIGVGKAGNDKTGQSFDILAAFKNDANADNIVTILVYQTAAGGGYIKNISAEITYTMDAANYTVQYLCGETAIKTAVTRTGAAGDAITLEASDKENVYVNDSKYIYVSDDAAGKTIASDGSTVVTVNYRQGGSYVVNAKFNDNVISTANVFEGDNAAIFVPYYQLAGGVLYNTPKVDKGSLSYGQVTLNNVTADTDINVTYTEDATQNAVFYAEGEDIATCTPVKDGFTEIRMSNGAAGYANNSVITTLEPGVYTLTTATRSGTTNFTVNGVNVKTLTSTGAVVTETSAEFTVKGTSELIATCDKTSSYFDYVLIRKVGEAPKNTIAAGKYTLTADVALAEGVTEEIVPADFKKYVGTYKSNATLAGDENSLTIAENDENGLFAGFEIQGDAVVLAATKTITLNGKVFNVRTAADAENGSLAITAEGDNYKMDAANVWYNGQKVATITNIVIAKAATAPVVAIEKSDSTITVTSTSETAALYYLCKPMSWLDEGETPESCLLDEIEGMGMMIDSEETWELYAHMGLMPAPKTFAIADYQEMYGGQEMFIIAANVGWNGEKLAVISNIVEETFTVPAPAPVVAIEKSDSTITVTSTSETAALYYLCKPMSWLDEGETPESCLLDEIEGMGMMIDSEETWELYAHMGLMPAPKTFTIADYQEMYGGKEMFIIAANVGWNGEKLAVISNIVEETFTVPETTGIKNVSAAKTLNAKFIENGKLVIISNGKKFNAAGVEMK